MEVVEKLSGMPWVTQVDLIAHLLKKRRPLTIVSTNAAWSRSVVEHAVQLAGVDESRATIVGPESNSREGRSFVQSTLDVRTGEITPC